MKIRSLSAWAFVAAAALAISGCQGMAGIRYHDGALDKLAGSGTTDGAMGQVSPHGEALRVEQPPHSRFHPVPTRPVFEPQPEPAAPFGAAILQRGERPEKIDSDPVPVLAASSLLPKPVPVTSAVVAAGYIEPTAASPQQAGPSSRKPRTMKSVLLAPASSQTSQPLGVVGQLKPAGNSSATDDAAQAKTLGDGWRPRVAQ